MKSEKPLPGQIKAKKILIWLLLFAVLLLLARIGARHYFRDTPVKPGTFSVTIGRVFAQWAVALLLLQSVLAVRIRFLDRIFGLDRLLKFHRASGIICFLMAFFHPMLMYLSGLKKAGPLSSDQWPEAIGAICIIGLWLAVVSSVWRKFFDLGYQSWLRLHRITASVVMLALAHMFSIESAMRSGWIFACWLVVIILWVCTIAAAKFFFPLRFASGESFVVSSATEAAKNVRQLNLVPAKENAIFDFLPGQFAFISFDNPQVAKEEHPVTIASAPDDRENLQFLIKGVGDWTKSLSAIKAGDKAKVIAPFGAFSPFRYEVDNLILIAGGIGITPMLSILRQLFHEKAEMPVKLIWSYKTSAEAPCFEELETLSRNYSSLEIIRVVTRESTEQKESGKRLDREALIKLVPEYRQGCLVMICGPLKMMKDIRRYLLESGYPDSAIVFEEFAF
jgi:3-phenylpropionate/trans-cinnamate dioxygenase ferredoxin reductase subunit